MKKIVLLSLVLIMVLATSSSFAYGATSNSFDPQTAQFTIGSDIYHMNNVPIFMNGDVPYLSGSNTLVNYKLIAKVFQFPLENMHWDNDKQQLKIYREFKEITLTVGSKIAIVDNVAVNLDTAPEAINGEIMVPLRFIAETFGDDVAWESQLQQINIRNYSDYVDGIFITR